MKKLILLFLLLIQFGLMSARSAKEEGCVSQLFNFDWKYQSGNTKKIYQGFVMAIWRSNQTSGNVKIKASLKGLKSAEKKMVTIE